MNAALFLRFLLPSFFPFLFYYGEALLVLLYRGTVDVGIDGAGVRGEGEVFCP